MESLDLELLAHAEGAADPAAAAALLDRVDPERLSVDELRRLALLCERLGRTRQARWVWLKVAARDPRLATVRVVERHLGSKALAAPEGTPVRLALLTSFTAAPLRSFLAVSCASAGLPAEIRSWEYRAIDSLARDGGSELYGFEPDVIVLAVDLDDAVPDWLLLPFDEGVRDRARQSVRGIVEAAQALSANRPEALVAVHTLRVPKSSVLGSIDASAEHGVGPTVRALNAELVGELVRASAIPLDFAGWVADVGRSAIDPKLQQLCGCSYADGLLELAARKLLGPVLSRAGRTAKVVVVDLDDTLWGGVLGEDGIDGIQLGPSPPGSAYLDLQRALGALERRGILLAIASKNDEGEARACLRAHPHMLLREDRFAAMRIGWGDKPASVREMAAELGLGLPSFVFVDDNPVERERMRAQLPDVHTVELPADPSRWSQVLLDLVELDTISMTAEDRERTRTYAGRREAAELKAVSSTPEDFYRGLGLEATIEPLREGTVARVAQLTQKTNQWNLTLRRHTDSDVRAWLGDLRRRVYTLRVKDRFADHGLVGAAIVECGLEEWTLANMVMSCRVIGLTVETALLAAVVEDARESSGRALGGSWIRGPRNDPARDFFERHGFSPVDRGAKEEKWSMDLARAQVRAPDWVKVHRAGA